MTHSTGALARGDKLDGRFHIVGVLSEGRLSTVFNAIDMWTNRPVIVKVPPRHLTELHRREALIGRQLDHPAILKFISIDACAKSQTYLVTEYLEGHSLRDELHSRGSLPTADALKLGIQICGALDYLHRRHIIHGDIAPGNIMLCPDGSARLIDFGLARWAGNRTMPFSGFAAHVGTPEYMAPEQVKGTRCDARIDLYAVGAVLYEMVTGRRPFDTVPEDHRLRARLVGDPVAPSRYVAGLSLHVEEIILHALARRPAERYASAAAMLAELEAPESVPVIGRASRLKPPILAKLWWPVARLAGVSLLVAVALFFVFLAFLTK